MHAMSFLVATLLAASAPYALLDGREHDRTNDRSYPVKIIALNGKAYHGGGRDDIRIEPGFNYVQLATTFEGRGGRVTEAPFPMVAKPCIRYQLSALHERSNEPRRWTVQVVEEPIRDCDSGEAAATEKSTEE
jgi:hypothetical protein